MPPNPRNTSITGSYQQGKQIKLQAICQGYPSALRLILFCETKRELPEELGKEILKHDRNAVVKRNWDSVLDTECDVIVDCSDDIDRVLRRVNENWRRRVKDSHAIRPEYFVIGKPNRHRLARFEVERLGGHFLYLVDVPTRFGEELEQIRLRIAHLERSLPHWVIIYEGNGRTLQASVSFFDRRGLQLLRAEDGLAAELAVLITNNGMSRSIAAWRKIMMNNPLFKPAGGGFNVPSRTTLRMHIHRDYIRDLQRSFDEVRSGYSAGRVLGRIRLGEKTVGYRIKGQWEAVRP